MHSILSRQILMGIAKESKQPKELRLTPYQMEQLRSLQVIGMTKSEALEEVVGLIYHRQEKSIRV